MMMQPARCAIRQRLRSGKSDGIRRGRGDVVVADACRLTPLRIPYTRLFYVMLPSQLTSCWRTTPRLERSCLASELENYVRITTRARRTQSADRRRKTTAPPMPDLPVSMRLTQMRNPKAKSRHGGSRARNAQARMSSWRSRIRVACLAQGTPWRSQCRLTSRRPPAATRPRFSEGSVRMYERFAARIEGREGRSDLRPAKAHAASRNHRRNTGRAHAKPEIRIRALHG